MKNHFGKILLTIILLIGICFWVFRNIETMFVFFGTYSLLMFINLSIVSIGNALIGRASTDTTTDVFWKMFFIIVTSISYCIGFNKLF